MINEEKTTFWRYPIRKFDFTECRGSEKWATYIFTKNVYDVWMAPHFKMICSALEDLHLRKDLAASHQSELPVSESFGLSKQLEHQTFSQEAGEQDSQSKATGLQPITPDPSTQTTTKKKKKTAKAC